MAQDWKDLLASLKGDEPSNGHEMEMVEQEVPSDQEQNLRIVLDKKGRKGKMATIIEGFTLDDESVDAIASELKRKIGTGGSSRGGEILLQGDWRVKAQALLKEKGFKVKLS